MSNPQTIATNKQLAAMQPTLLLRGEKPRLIDEWQIAPELWDAVRWTVDHSEENCGLFILTGSSVPPDMTKVIHSGTGRVGWLKMRPMTLWESGDSSGEISLSALFDDVKDIGGVNKNSLERIAFLTCRGGWPNSIKMKEEIALEQAFDYIDAIEKRDLYNFDGIERNPERIHRLLRSYARLQGSQATNKTIQLDMQANGNDTLNKNTVSSYIKALKSIFIIEESSSWNPCLRSRVSLRTTDTRYFTDSSIATAALGLGPNDLMNDLTTFGLIFETLCIRDLRVYAEASSGQVYHYKDRDGLECDAVVHLRDGRYGLIEVKLGGEEQIEEGIETLQKLSDKIDTTRMKNPSFLMVLTAIGDYAFRDKSGVFIVPIGCLKD